MPTAFTIDPDDAMGVGHMFITDARLLVSRPAVPGQYHKVSHDAGFAYEILCLADDMGEYEWHIICREDPATAHQLLDRVFYAYVDACCLELRCDARVDYIVNGEVVRTEEYGFSDGCHTMSFKVYCMVAEDSVEALLPTLVGDAFPANRSYVVVRPDESDRGYIAQGFITDSPPANDDDVEPDPYGHYEI